MRERDNNARQLADNPIETYVVPKELTFQPGGTPALFEITVVNRSDRFASFQVELLAAGSDLDAATRHWYELSPKIGSKQPPGDVTRFRVAIVDSPIPGFVGSIDVTARAFSVDLQRENREILRLNLERGTGAIPLQLDLPVREFQVYPGDRVEIPVSASNPSQYPANARIRGTGLDASWWVGSGERTLQLLPGRDAQIALLCQVPDRHATASQVYSFAIEASYADLPPTRVEGSLEVLPQGEVNWTRSPERARIPSQRAWLPQFRVPPAVYTLEFTNHSNLHQQVGLEVRGDDAERCQIAYPEEAIALPPNATEEVSVEVRSRRSWLGRTRSYWLELAPILSDDRLGSPQPSTQLARLDVRPIVPVWLLVGGGLILLWLAWWLSWLNPDNPRYGHQAAVNSVEFNGMALNLVSGSSDQTLIKWEVEGFFNPLDNQEVAEIGNADKAVRAVQHKPVDNDVVAAGLENGEIQLWNLLGDGAQLRDSFVYQKDDRVLALEFTRDSRHLFSGHGSGLVLQWNATYDLERRLERAGKTEIPTRQRKFDFAVYALRLMGQGDRYLAVAGRFNQLIVWDWETDRLQEIPYPPGGRDDYILSLDVAEYRPHLLVASDNQGTISLWNLHACLDSDRPCNLIDRWSNAHGGEPTRSVALSADGCYLASGGGDGRTMLWPLASGGRRAEAFLDGIEIARSRDGQSFNSVDIKLIKNDVLVASGSDDTQVRVDRARQLPQVGCDWGRGG